MEKKVVHYLRSKGYNISIGHSAWVVPVDHPSTGVENGNAAHTTTVESYDVESGIFETKNTIYRPAVES